MGATAAAGQSRRPAWEAAPVVQALSGCGLIVVSEVCALGCAAGSREEAQSCPADFAESIGRGADPKPLKLDESRDVPVGRQRAG